MKKIMFFCVVATLLASCHAQPTPPQAAQTAKKATPQKPVNREGKVAKLLTTGLDVPLTSSERREVAYYIDSLTAAHKINRKPSKTP